MKIIQPVKQLRGILTVPGDKSISHRGIMLGALSNGTTRVTNFLSSADCRSTIECFQKMGINIEENGTTVLIHGSGLHGLREPDALLNTGNSGTTTRLLAGLLSAQPFDSVINGDESIRKRPMKRVIDPLTQMGASIHATNRDFCPLHICGKQLHGIEYTLPVASAQLKSAIILAAMYADGETIISEPVPSRDHTERMIRMFGGNISKCGDRITIPPQSELYAQDFSVPSDISSAAFFLVAGCIVPNSEIKLCNVGINPTRTGILDVLKKMGAEIKLENMQKTAEPVADLIVCTSALHGCEISGALIPRLIDELPVIAVAAAYANGQTVIKDAAELKVKESNRIRTVVDELTKTGIDITETEDGMIINGGSVHGADFESYGDHRVAMAMAICALAADSPSTIHGSDAVDISYPNFFSDLMKLTKEV